jgi:flagellar hook-associated protein 3 FlgL
MRVPTNNASESVIVQIQKLATRQAQLQLQIATGQRIFLPADNPAAVGRVLTMENERAQIDQFERNASTALEISQASFAGLKGLKGISDRAGEIATLGSGIVSPDAFRAYASEVNQLIEQSLQSANTRFRNDYLFAGTAIGAPPFTATRSVATGQITAIAYAGNANQAEIQLSETASIAPGTTGGTNTGVRDFINQLVALRDALVAGDATAVAATRPQLEGSENLLVNALSEHGAIELRIEVNQAQQLARGDNLDQLISNEVDADLPETVVRLGQTSTAYEAALSSATKILQMSLLDYLR